MGRLRPSLAYGHTVRLEEDFTSIFFAHLLALGLEYEVAAQSFGHVFRVQDMRIWEDDFYPDDSCKAKASVSGSSALIVSSVSGIGVVPAGGQEGTSPFARATLRALDTGRQFGVSSSDAVGSSALGSCWTSRDDVFPAWGQECITPFSRAAPRASDAEARSDDVHYVQLRSCFSFSTAASRKLTKALGKVVRFRVGEVSEHGSHDAVCGCLLAAARGLRKRKGSGGTGAPARGNLLVDPIEEESFPPRRCIGQVADLPEVYTSQSLFSFPFVRCQRQVESKLAGLASIAEVSSLLSGSAYGGSAMPKEDVSFPPTRCPDQVGCRIEAFASQIGGSDRPKEDASSPPARCSGQVGCHSKAIVSQLGRLKAALFPRSGHREAVFPAQAPGSGMCHSLASDAEEDASFPPARRPGQVGCAGEVPSAQCSVRHGGVSPPVTHGERVVQHGCVTGVHPQIADQVAEDVSSPAAGAVTGQPLLVPSAGAVSSVPARMISGDLEDSGSHGPPAAGDSTPSSEELGLRDTVLAATLLATWEAAPFEFVTFDIARGPLIGRIPHGQGPQEAVAKALAEAPWPGTQWVHTVSHVPGFPLFQIVLIRPMSQVTVVLDDRPCDGSVVAIEVPALPLSGDRLVGWMPAGVFPQVHLLQRSSQLGMYYNQRPWLLQYERPLYNGDVVLLAPRAEAHIQASGTSLRWAPPSTSSRARVGHCPPLIVVRIGILGFGTSVGTAPGSNFLLALARAIERLLQTNRRFEHYILIASQLQDCATQTYQEVRLVAIESHQPELSVAWLDRRLIGGGLQIVATPSFLHAQDFQLVDSALAVDLAPVLDIAFVASGATLQQIPSGAHSNPLQPISALFGIVGISEVASWTEFPRLGLAAAFGPAEGIARSLQAWVAELSRECHIGAESSLGRILSPGSCLTFAVGRSPPQLDVARSAQGWLVAHHGAGLLYDCQLALGEASFFVFVPDSLQGIFAAAIQIVRAQPFLRLLSRGAVGRTPEERLRFVSFQADEGHVAHLPLEEPVRGALEERDDAAFLLQRSARTVVSGSAAVVPGDDDLRGSIPVPIGFRHETPCSAVGASLETAPGVHDHPCRTGSFRLHVDGTQGVCKLRDPGGLTLPGENQGLSRFSSEGHDYVADPLPCQRTYETSASGHWGVWDGSANPVPEPGVSAPIEPLVLLQAHLSCVTQVGLGVRVGLPLHDLLCAHTPEQDRLLRSGEEVAAAIYLLTSGLPPCVLLNDVSGLPLPVWLRSAVSAFPICSRQALHEAGASVLILTDGSQRGERVGHAIVVVVCGPDGSQRFLGMFALNSKACDLGEEAFDAQEAEAAAICLAMLWSLSVPLHVPVEIRFDCKAAGLAASGDWRPASCQGTPRKLHTTARHLAHLLEGCGRHVTFEHVCAHSGVVWNELADVGASVAARSSSPQPSLPARVHALLQSPLLPWAWLLPYRAAQDLPSFWELAIGSAAQRVRRDMPARAFRVSRSDCDSKPSKVQVAWKGLSYNVCSLGSGDTVADEGGGLWGPMRSVLLQAHLSGVGASCIGLQETRLPADSAYVTDKWLCIQSAKGEDGQGGCALWVNRAVPWSSRAGKLGVSDAHVIVSRPRVLLVRLHSPGLDAVFLVAHAPHAKRSASERLQFWDYLEEVVAGSLRLNDELFVCIDSNGRLLDADECDTRPCARPDPESANGQALARFVNRFDLAAPATTSVHEGEHNTWTSPTGFRQRIDFVLVPAVLLAGVRSSRVCAPFEGAVNELDHRPVEVEISFAASKGCSALQRVGCRLTPPVLEDGSACALVPQPWSSGVDSHLACLTKNVQGLCHKQEHGGNVSVRRPFVSPEVLHLVCFKRHLRRTLRVWEAELRTGILAAVFGSWAHAANGSRAVAQYGTQVLDVLIAVQWRALRQASSCLRSVLRRAKASFLEAQAVCFAASVHQNDFAKAYAVLRPLRSGAKLRSRFQPLVGVCERDGRPCGTAADAALRWSAHFGDIEAGTLVSAEQLVEEYKDSVLSQPVASGVQLADLPTRLEWEDQFRGLAKHKAPGSDGISHAVIKAFRGGIQARSYALALKVSVTGTEPLRWRGGTVAPLYKGKGSLSDLSSFRSILVSEVLGKRYHAWVRRRLVPWLERVAHSLQHGPVGGHSTLEMSLYIRAFQSHMHERRVPSACLFVDIQAAFYSLLRHFLVGHVPQIGDLVRLCQRLGLSEEVTASILQAVDLDCATGDSELNGIWKQRVTDILSVTWFQIDKSPSLVRTGRGSRPGDPLADLLFGVVMAGVLRDVQSQFVRAKLSPSLHTDGLLPGTERGESTSPAVGSWQDDAVFLIAAGSNSELFGQCRTAVRIVHTAFESRGLTVNYKQGKTELMVRPIGLGSQQIRQAIYAKPSFQLVVLQETLPPLLVTLVPQYTHLGAVVEWAGRLAPDISRAVEGARAVGGPLRRHVFGNAAVPLPARVVLFRSLVMSKVLYGTGAWAGLHVQEQRQWQAGVMSLYRMLVPGKFLRSNPKILHVDLVRLVRLPPPLSLLRIERLRLFKQLLVKQSRPLWTLLEASLGSSRCWMSNVISDLKWIKELFGRCNKVFPFQQWDPEELADFCTQVQARQRDFELLLDKAWELAVSGFCAGDFVEEGSAHRECSCPICRQVCHGRMGVRSHLALKHRVFPAAHFYASGSTCGACQRDFHHPRRLVRHLQHAKGCMRWLVAFAKPRVPLAQCRTKKGSKAERFLAWHRPCMPGRVVVELASDDEGYLLNSAELYST